jgi:hypothetical protein
LILKELNNINELVMSTVKSYEGEEPSYIEGQIANYLSSKIPIFNIYGKCIGLLGVSFDITEKKKIEELENKLKMREELYKISKEVSHDIASPVSTLNIVQHVLEDKKEFPDKWNRDATGNGDDKSNGWKA